MKSLIIILLVLFSVCAAANPSSDFRAWMSKYGKSYANPTELAKRFNIFKANMKKIYEENLKANGSYTLALNAFSDMSQQEWASKYLLPSSKGRMTYNSTSNPGSTSSPGSYRLPSSVDWRKKGAVVGVKNQGQCGSCWAFSTVAAVESINFIVTRRLISLSEQELLDCDTISQGCNYGYQTSAMSFMVKNGVDSEARYPYKFAPSGYCPLYKKRRVNIDDFRYVPSYDELALQTAVAQQPVSVYIDATYLQSYSSGIYTGPCSQTTGNHFLLIVGYGRTSQGTSYWIAKNSWGTSWGENGYIRFPRYMNKCNINREAIYPVKYS